MRKLETGWWHVNQADFEIGIITKPQGIKGEVRVLPTTDDPARFSLLIGQNLNIDEKIFKLASARQQKGIVVIKLAEINDRNGAEEIVGKKIKISAEKALPLEDGEYYVRDLAGLKVESEDGEELGILSKVVHTNANDVYVIEPPEGNSFMIPAIKDVVLSVSVKEKRMVVRLMDGLRELLA